MQKNPKITIIIPMRNASTTIVKSLVSVHKQRYSIKEIIIIDNHSDDSSVQLVNDYIKALKIKNIRLVKRSQMLGIGSSYNLGMRMCHTPIFVTFHSDSVLPTVFELKKLVTPLVHDPRVVASIPLVVHPLKIWEKYNFWQKLHFSRVAGTSIPSGNGKFDCFRKKAFQKIGGFDEVIYTKDIGSEDADLYYKLRQIGSVIKSSARVVHLHKFDNSYTMIDYIKHRKFHAITNGVLIRYHFSDLVPNGYGLFVKPIIAVGCFIPIFNYLFWILACTYSFIYVKKMYASPSTRTDYRILTLPVLFIFLLFYETIYMIYGFTFTNKRW